MCLHGFTDTWRSWDLVRPKLERHHDVLAPTLAGHAGGPSLHDDITEGSLADAVEEAMTDAGFETAHLVGNSLGGYVAFQLAARGRARSVVALAPAGGWRPGDEWWQRTLEAQARSQRMLVNVAPLAPVLVASRAGRRRATEYLTTNFDHIPSGLVLHLVMGAARCDSALALLQHAREATWDLEPALITCPVRIVWGTADRLLPWPAAGARYREWLPEAEWVELDGVGHCPQLDVPLETAELILGLTRR